MSAPHTLKSLYRYITDQFKNVDLEMPDLDARFIITERTDYDWSDIIARPDAPVKDHDHANIISDVKQRLSGKPLSRIYGEREFWGLPFKLSDATLDPRPDTELIIEIALKRFSQNRPLRILDLGTGSGCILIALLSEFPNATGVGVDLSFGAVKTASENAVQNRCMERVDFVCGSWGDALSPRASADSFDLIVSNPPYITSQVIPTLAQEVQNHDPILSLDGGDDGLQAYKKIFSQIKSLIHDDGFALFEIGYDQDKDVMRLAEDSGFALRTVHVDISGNPRVVEISCGDK